MAALNNENCEEHLRNIMAQNLNDPRSQEDYITEVEPANSGSLRNRSGDVPERIWLKSGNE